MENVQQLVEITLELKDLSRDIQKEGLYLLDETDGIVETVRDAYPHLESKKVTQYVREALVYILRDAQDVQKELSFFEQFIASGLPVSESVCPLLSQVWRGDMYGCEGIRGLSELVKDLNTQLEQIDRHFLMTRVLRLVDRKG